MPKKSGDDFIESYKTWFYGSFEVLIIIPICFSLRWKQSREAIQPRLTAPVTLATKYFSGLSSGRNRLFERRWSWFSHEINPGQATWVSSVFINFFIYWSEIILSILMKCLLIIRFPRQIYEFWRWKDTGITLTLGRAPLYRRGFFQICSREKIFSLVSKSLGPG